jgi:hypothetical protein
LPIVNPKVQCPAPPPPPPPSCGFFDVKCGWSHPGWWWNGNKGWVQAGVMVAGIGVCAFTAGAGCYLAGAVGAGMSMADRTYEFVNSGAYRDGGLAWGEYALGMGVDALGFIPGGGAAARGAENAGKRMLAASTGCLHSFDPSTPVLLADDTTKPIKDVEIGDRVKATDPQTGQDTAEPVTALHLNQDTDLADVTISGPNGESVLHTTQHHPFWNETRHQWTDAADLRPGDHLRAADGSTQVVTTVIAFTGSRQMRDLTVATVHTYYVIAGNTPVLVHNCSLTVISTDQVVAHNRASLNIHGEHGFAGVYDPTTGAFEGRLSGGPNAVVSRRGGHADIDWDAFGSPGNTVGFTAIRNGDMLQVSWNSASVNHANFGNVAAPINQRAAIMDALRSATGFDVRG